MKTMSRSCTYIKNHKDTPLKTNMEQKKLAVGRCFSFSKGAFSGSMLVFGGCKLLASSDDVVLAVVDALGKMYALWLPLDLSQM